MYLYLDIDGVLVKKSNPLSNFYSGLEFTKSSLNYLERLIKDYPSIKIVISSDWKKYKSIELVKDTYFKHTYLYNSIVDKTVDNLSCREEEIEVHIVQNKINWENVIILDDLNLKGICGKYLIRTNEDYGFCESEYLQVKNKLERNDNDV